MGNAADELSVVAGAGARTIDLRPNLGETGILAARVGGGTEQDETSDHREPETHATHRNSPFLSA